MNPKDFTRAHVLKAIDDSGYPFELKVAAELLANGAPMTDPWVAIGPEVVGKDVRA
jgi:hypothetical protein